MPTLSIPVERQHLGQDVDGLHRSGLPSGGGLARALRSWRVHDLKCAVFCSSKMLVLPLEMVVLSMNKMLALPIKNGGFAMGRGGFTYQQWWFQDDSSGKMERI